MHGSSNAKYAARRNKRAEGQRFKRVETTDDGREIQPTKTNIVQSNTSPTTNQAHGRTKKNQKTAYSRECGAKTIQSTIKKHATTGTGLKCVDKTCFVANNSREGEGGTRYNKEKIKTTHETARYD